MIRSVPAEVRSGIGNEVAENIGISVIKLYWDSIKDHLPYEARYPIILIKTKRNELAINLQQIVQMFSSLNGINTDYNKMTILGCKSNCID